MTINLAKEFPQESGLFYLNHAAVSPWPARTANAIRAFAEENLKLGARNYPKWEALEAQVRKQLADLIKAENTDDIALVKNTSEGLSMVAYGLEWERGDEILISDEEFPSNRIVWESLKDKGVSVREISLKGAEPEANLIGEIRGKTRLLAISSVQYGSGTRLDMEKLGEACHSAGILFCVDAIQSIGAYDFDINKCQADFVIADGHKWMMAPEGLGLFYSRKEVRENMKVNEYGWHMVENAGDYASRDWNIAESARRFECGSPNMLGVHGLNASLSLIEDYGMKNIESDLMGISKYLRQQLKQIPGCELNQHPVEKYHSAITSFSVKGNDSEDLSRKLRDKGVICVNRGGGIRFSPHFYTPKRVIDGTIEILEDLIN